MVDEVIDRVDDVVDEGLPELARLVARVKGARADQWRVLQMLCQQRRSGLGCVDVHAGGHRRERGTGSARRGDQVWRLHRIWGRLC